MAFPSEPDFGCRGIRFASTRLESPPCLRREVRADLRLAAGLGVAAEGVLEVHLPQATEILEAFWGGLGGEGGCEIQEAAFLGWVGGEKRMGKLLLQNNYTQGNNKGVNMVA